MLAAPALTEQTDRKYSAGRACVILAAPAMTVHTDSVWFEPAGLTILYPCLDGVGRPIYSTGRTY